MLGSVDRLPTRAACKALWWGLVYKTFWIVIFLLTVGSICSKQDLDQVKSGLQSPLSSIISEVWPTFETHYCFQSKSVCVIFLLSLRNLLALQACPKLIDRFKEREENVKVRLVKFVCIFKFLYLHLYYWIKDCADGRLQYIHWVTPTNWPYYKRADGNWWIEVKNMFLMTSWWSGPFFFFIIDTALSGLSEFEIYHYCCSFF